MNVRSLPGLQEITRRGARERMRAVGRACVREEKSLEETERDLEELFGGNSAPAIPTRITQEYALTGDPVRILDQLLEAHGLRAVLATLRSLADSRCDNGCTEWDDFGDVIAQDMSAERWRVASDALENLLLSGKVNAK